VPTKSRMNLSVIIERGDQHPVLGQDLDPDLTRHEIGGVVLDPQEIDDVGHVLEVTRDPGKTKDI